MAKAAQAEAVESKPAVKKEDLSGWSQANTQVEAFWNKEGVLKGKLVGGKEVSTQFGKSKLYMIQLTEPCSVVGEDDEISEASAGECVGVWGSAGLNALDNLSGCLVRLEMQPKQKLSGGRTFQPFDVKFKGQEKALHLVRNSKNDAPVDGADEGGVVPF